MQNIGTAQNMPTLNEYFTKIVVINLRRRKDRWEHVRHQCDLYNLEVERFDGIDLPGDGNTGCTESHGAVLRLIAEHGWERTLILEDDFEFRFDDAQDRFSRYVSQVPDGFWMLYLGGHYGNTINTRAGQNVIQFNHMKTTSSYAVTLTAAVAMAQYIHGIGPIDELYYNFHMKYPCYIFSPRLCIQYTSFSDLQMRVMDNQTCMEDSSHEDLLNMRDSL